jgi:hypothetical protein
MPKTAQKNRKKVGPLEPCVNTGSFQAAYKDVIQCVEPGLTFGRASTRALVKKVTQSGRIRADLFVTNHDGTATNILENALCRVSIRFGYPWLMSHRLNFHQANYDFDTDGKACEQRYDFWIEACREYAEKHVLGRLFRWRGQYLVAGSYFDQLGYVRMYSQHVHREFAFYANIIKFDSQSPLQLVSYHKYREHNELCHGGYHRKQDYVLERDYRQDNAILFSLKYWDPLGNGFQLPLEIRHIILRFWYKTNLLSELD